MLLCGDLERLQGGGGILRQKADTLGVGCLTKEDVNISQAIPTRLGKLSLGKWF